MKNFIISSLTALFFSFLFFAGTPTQSCAVEDNLQGQDTIQFLEYYGNSLVYDDYGEKIVVKIVDDACEEYSNYTINLKKKAVLNKMYCKGQEFVVCVVENDSNYSVLASKVNSPSEEKVRDYGLFISESEFPIFPCVGEHKEMHINYKSFNFENIENNSFREYCKSLKDFKALIEPTNEPCKHKVCFGGVDSQGIEHYFKTFIIRT